MASGVASRGRGVKMMTVKQLIATLRKMPPDAVVVLQDMDQSEDEISGYANTVTDMTEYLSTDNERRFVAIKG